MSDHNNYGYWLFSDNFKVYQMSGALPSAATKFIATSWDLTLTGLWGLWTTSQRQVITEYRINVSTLTVWLPLVAIKWGTNAFTLT